MRSCSGRVFFSPLDQSQNFVLLDWKKTKNRRYIDHRDVLRRVSSYISVCLQTNVRNQSNYIPSPEIIAAFDLFLSLFFLPLIESSHGSLGPERPHRKKYCIHLKDVIILYIHCSYDVVMISIEWIGQNIIGYNLYDLLVVVDANSANLCKFGLKLPVWYTATSWGNIFEFTG